MNPIRKIWKRIKLDAGFCHEGLAHARRLCAHSASADTESDIYKMQYSILRINHTLEKGLSMPSPRKGFGIRRSLFLMDRLGLYARLYGGQDAEFLTYPLQTLAGYISYTEGTGADVSEVRRKYETLLKEYESLTGHALPDRPAGTQISSSEDIREAARGDFRSLLESRHAIRAYSGEEVPEETIMEALSLAQLTPSACNRQGWKTHVFRGEKAVELVRWQEGCKGFEEQIRTAILVTADLRAFLDFEPYQAYVDGGLYAMNLLNALHYLGLGAIPISCGFKDAKLNEMRAAFSIPENEVPIVIVGTGVLPETVKYATSRRKDISKTNTFHE